MRRCALHFVIGLIGCMAWVSTAGAQSNAELIARFNAHNQDYATAISSGSIESAQESWDLMRPLARELANRGLSQYARYDRDMVRPGGASNQGIGRTDTAADDSDEDLVEEITVAVVDQLEIAVSADGYEGAVVVLNEEQTGFEHDLTTVDVTIRARVTDQHGDPLRTDFLGAEIDLPGSDFEWVGDHEFKVTFFTQGFGPVVLDVDVRLQGCCLAIVKHAVGLGTVRPGSTTSQTFAVSNTCDEPLEVAMPSGGTEFSFKIRDCGGGTSNLGSVVDGLGGNAMLGPDARCDIEVVWAPTGETSLSSLFSIESSVGLQPACATNFEVVGASSLGIEVVPSEMRFDDVVRVGDTVHAEYVLTNRSSDLAVTLTDVALSGTNGGDFGHGVIGFEGGQVQNGTLVLAPGGFTRGAVSFTPVSDGLRRAVLVISSSDPAVPLLRIPLSGLAELPPVLP